VRPWRRLGARRTPRPRKPRSRPRMPRGRSCSPAVEEHERAGDEETGSGHEEGGEILGADFDGGVGGTPEDIDAGEG
jgi:hypothetical protein